MKKIFIFLAFVFFALLINLNSAFAGSLACCLESNGYCYSNKDTSACTSKGGSVVGAEICYDASAESPYDSCKLVGCIFSNDRCSFIPKSRCEDVLKGRVDNTITSKELCDEVNYNVNLGCCLSDCRMKLRSQCTGEFDNQGCDTVDQCKVTGVREVCSEDGRTIKKVDSNSNQVGFPGLCPADTRCVVENNKPTCKSTSCKIGEETIVSVMDIGLSKKLVDKVEIDGDMLGLTEGEIENDRTSRKNGESWCIIYGTKDGVNWELMPRFKTLKELDIYGANSGELYLEGLGREFSAGQRHSVYSCNDGNIIDEDGDVFRGKNGVCFENNQFAYYYNEDDIKWAMCEPRNDKEKKKLEEADNKLDSEVFFNDNLKDPRVIAHRNAQKDPPFSQSILVDNYDLNKDCKAIYPVGSRFYPPPFSQTGLASELRCGKCGGSAYDSDRCGENECYRAGDCSFKSAGAFQRLKDCGKGALIVWGAYRLGKSLEGLPGSTPSSPTPPIGPTGPPASLPSAPFVPPEAGSAAGKIVAEQTTQTAVSQLAQQGAQQLSNWRKLQIAAETTEAISGTFYLARSIRQGDSPSYADDDVVGTIPAGQEVEFEDPSVGTDGSIRAHPIGYPDDNYVVLSTGESGSNSLIVED